MNEFEKFHNQFGKFDKIFELQRLIKESSGLSKYMDNIFMPNSKLSWLDDSLFPKFFPTDKYLEFNNFISKVTMADTSHKLIPQEFSTDFYKLATSQQSILNDLNSLIKPLDFAPQYFNNLYSASTNFATSIFQTGLKNNDWQTLNEFRPYYDRISEITTEVKEKKSVDIEFLEKFDLIVQEIHQRLDSLTETKKQKFVKEFYNLLNVISFILTIYAFYTSCTDLSHEEVINKVEAKIEDVKQEQQASTGTVVLKVEQMTEKINARLDSLFARTKQLQIRIKCQVKSKPINNSGIITTLNEKSTVSVLDSSKKYYLIISRDQNEQYPITGWILKKHTIAL